MSDEDNGIGSKEAEVSSLKILGLLVIIFVTLWLFGCVFEQAIRPYLASLFWQAELSFADRHLANLNLAGARVSQWCVFANSVLAGLVLLGGLSLFSGFLGTLTEISWKDLKKCFSVFFFAMVLVCLCLWLFLAGSHHLYLDLALLTAAVLLQFKKPRPSLLFPSLARRAFRAAMCFWIASSSFDAFFPLERVPVNFSRFELMSSNGYDARYTTASIGLALSGGGYRAALVHAGVLAALESFGARVGYLSCVSGGSIIGAFYASGGDPKDFATACRERRFRLLKDVTDIQNLVRLPFPAEIPGTRVKLLWFYNFGRSDVQAASLNRAFWGAKTFGNLRVSGGPNIILCSTDLISGSIVGISPDWILMKSLPSPAQKRSYAQIEASPEALRSVQRQYTWIVPEPDSFPDDVTVGQIVSASGAFPAAFSPVIGSISVRQARRGEAKNPIPVELVDGGLRDNTGLEMLYGAAKLVGPWKPDVFISSDASAFVQAVNGDVSALARSLDVIYSNQGIEGPQHFDGVFGNSLQFPRDSAILLAPQTLWGGTKGRFENWATEKLGPKPDVAVLQRIARAVPDETLATGALQACRPDITNGNLCVWDSDGVQEAVFIRAFLHDLHLCLESFGQTSTLEDQLDGPKIDRLYRLGYYTVALQWKDIEKALIAAAARKQGGKTQEQN